MAGCSQAPNTPGGVPPLLFAANPQAGVLVVLGSESSASWDNVVLRTSGDPLCSIEAPDSGAMQPGQAASLRYGGKAWMARTNMAAICIVAATYNGTTLGTYTFQDPALAAQSTSTASTTQPATTTAPAKPPPNGTVPR